MPLKAYSIGGKEFTVTVNGDDVHLEWIDPPAGQDGDALLEPREARRLARLLLEKADMAEMAEWIDNG